MGWDGDSWSIIPFWADPCSFLSTWAAEHCPVWHMDHPIRVDPVWCDLAGSVIFTGEIHMLVVYPPVNSHRCGVYPPFADHFPREIWFSASMSVDPRVGNSRLFPHFEDLRSRRSTMCCLWPHRFAVPFKPRPGNGSTSDLDITRSYLKSSRFIIIYCHALMFSTLSSQYIHT